MLYVHFIPNLLNPVLQYRIRGSRDRFSKFINEKYIILTSIYSNCALILSRRANIKEQIV